MPKIYIETFGCQMNEADSQYIADRAATAGYEIATKAEDASVVVLNTCTVRDNAERRAYGRMGHFKMLKERDPHVRLVVMGCLAEQDRDRMQTHRAARRRGLRHERTGRTRRSARGVVLRGTASRCTSG